MKIYSATATHAFAYPSLVQSARTSATAPWCPGKSTVCVEGRYSYSNTHTHTHTQHTHTNTPAHTNPPTHPDKSHNSPRICQKEARCKRLLVTHTSPSTYSPGLCLHKPTTQTHTCASNSIYSHLKANQTHTHLCLPCQGLNISSIRL
jgi:hypothetical protein